MSQNSESTKVKKHVLGEVRYSLTDLWKEVQAEREVSSIGQEIVDQSEISKLFNRKKKVRGGQAGK